MLKRLVFIVASFLPFALMAQNATELKFGHVNSQEILMLLPEVKEAEKQLEIMSKSYENELEKMNVEYETKVQDFIKNSKDMEEEIKKIRQSEIISLEQRITLFKQTANESLQKKQEALLNPIVEKVQKAIKQVGEENGFIYIFDLKVPTLLYYSAKSIDVTPLLKKKLNLK
jgi:outer membrane protein